MPRITTSLTAAAKNKGETQESSRAAVGVTSTVPHRVTAQMSVAIEDVAAVGTDSSEATLRQKLAQILSDQLDQFAPRSGQSAEPYAAGGFHRPEHGDRQNPL